jgi:hypothetical protein
MKQNARESLQITLHRPVRKPRSRYHTSYTWTDSSAVYKKWGEQSSKSFSLLVYLANIWQKQLNIWPFKHVIRKQLCSLEFGEYFGLCYTYSQSVGNGQVVNTCPNALFPQHG